MKGRGITLTPTLSHRGRGIFSTFYETIKNGSHQNSLKHAEIFRELDALRWLNRHTSSEIM